jgi:hypothetical protein
MLWLMPFTKNVAPKYDELNLKNIATQRTYMKAILELSPKSEIFRMPTALYE